MALAPHKLELPKDPSGRKGVRVPQLDKSVYVGGIGSKLAGGIITGPLQLGRLSQIAKIADQLSEGHTMSYGTEVFAGRPSVMSDPFATQIIEQNQQIQVLKVAEDALDDGIDF